MVGIVAASQQEGVKHMSEKELMEMVAAEEKRLNLGSEEFLQRHQEIMDEADRIQKREQKRKEERQNMEELKKALVRLDVHGDFDTRIYEHIIIVYLDQEYFGTFNTKSKGFIDLDVSRIGGRGDEH